MTLKMDIFHGGTEEADYDHNFTNENLLNLSIPSDVESVNLESCLEHYCNNLVEVSRGVVARRRDLALKTSTTSESQNKREDDDHCSEKANATHIESKEVGSSTPQSPTDTVAPSFDDSKAPTRPMFSRQRGSSIVKEAYLYDKGDDDMPGLERKGSRIISQVTIPAFQFFNLVRKS